ncbi:hypothetical protein A1Q2_03010 [Trichosporon asahii var. asahii CBS 8904]|uniref:Uncharacterized protein n=2 Tax=Trichosporon asahii var. asahii TaxID=189963 RepID=K1VFE9_TRIAC|nr:hypothetical protein A1Q1_06929 [Trichosporon asahii var. asahii CBS 2479]EJT51843.1 hypothetical protein A1Q1_06929 [Trichosporon asahii var. asahii CBS 2479]EKD02780.1 hypothetical protein A1Q2_03010 [Trichosporon asahii var. asahii CBS 8904]
MASSTGPWAQQPQPAQPPTFRRDPNSTPTSSTFSSMSNQPQTRKRHADDDEAPSLDRTGPPDHKRRRPNLANGFQAMSISGSNPSDLPPQWYSHPGSAVTDDTDEDGLEPTRPPPDGDVGVEILPDRSPSHSISSRPSFTHPSRPGLWHRSSSFSSTSPSEDDYDSDATFRLPHQRAPPQQPTSVEQPEIITPTTPKHTTGPPHVDYMDSAHKRKISRDMDSSPELRSKRRRPSTDFDMDLPDSQRGKGWYEPEKDRIVVTSLDSPSPEPSPELDDMRSRSTTASPPPRDSGEAYNYEENRNLSQPGQNGFTISPSLLTHILNAQRDQFGTQPNFSVEPAERGLVLYRPLGGMPAEDVVRQWQQKAKRAKQVRPQIPDPDGHRFELVDDDEDLMNGPAVVGVPSDELWSPGTGNISQMDTDMPPPGAGGMDMEPDGDVEMG